MSYGIGTFDAIHLASAEHGNAVFIRHFENGGGDYKRSVRKSKTTLQLMMLQKESRNEKNVRDVRSAPLINISSY